MTPIVGGAALARAAGRMIPAKEYRVGLDEWGFPRTGASRVLAHGNVVTPAAPVLPATTVMTETLVYRVKQGHVFLLSEIVLAYIGTGFAVGSGDILWILDRNAPINLFPFGYIGGVVSPMAARVKGFEALDFPAGSFEVPWRLAPPEIFAPGDELRAKAVTTTAIPVGAPNRFISVFKGWLVPAGEIG